MDEPYVSRNYLICGEFLMFWVVFQIFQMFLFLATNVLLAWYEFHWMDI
jgi:hypothetical protein